MPVVGVVQAMHMGLCRVGGRVHVVRVAVARVCWVMLSPRVRVRVRVWMGVAAGAWVGAIPVVEVGHVLHVKCIVARG